MEQKRKYKIGIRAE
jgi:alanine dehydrogenase